MLKILSAARLLRLKKAQRSMYHLRSAFSLFSLIGYALFIHRLEKISPTELKNLGEQCGLSRNPGESDEQFKDRIAEMWSKNHWEK